jgi:NADP-reducing hydrogenase subunit HndB
MPKLKSVQELTQVRESAKTTLKQRLETGTTIYIGMGTCGIAAGAREVMQAIEQELAKRQIQAHVASVGCIGMCVKEPLVDIQQAGKSHILYANIQPEMVPRLIQEHLIKGEPVSEWVICRMPAE